MKRHVDWLTFLVALGFMCAAGQCAAQEGKLAPEKRAQIEDAVSKFMARSGAPGVSAAVVVNGERAWSEVSAWRTSKTTCR